ncbi:MAG: VWA domain-containing protein [Chloroflexota bacterium]|nr:VWA domain-containing protein [Chloroflexota bacterium]
MSLLWPGFLLLLALVPLLVLAYILVLRKQRVGLRYSSLALVRAALPKYSRWRRHLPFALFLAALTGLVFALAHPVDIVSVPTGQATIILAIDVSGSMRQNDIDPSRIEAAKAAALSFVRNQKSSTEIGIVAFAGYAELIQSPTTDQGALENAIKSLTTARGTAIGSGILTSIDAIADIDKLVAPSNQDSSIADPAVPVPKGAFAPDIIVLLTDGVATSGVPPLDAAQQAVTRGVRVYTIGFGTANGQPDFGPPGFQGGRGQSGRGQGGFGGGGQFGGFKRGIDEETLKQVASMTDGKYYAASSASELEKVFEGLPTYLITKHEVVDISVAFAGLGIALVTAALLLGQRWHPLP